MADRAAAAAAAAKEAPEPATPEAQVLALLASQAKAWNEGNLEGFCAVYDDGALFVTPSGLTKGRQAVLDRYRKRYPDAAARGTLSLEPVEVRRIGGRALSLAARWKLTYEGKAPAEGWTLLVLERRRGGWRIVHDASM